MIIFLQGKSFSFQLTIRLLHPILSNTLIIPLVLRYAYGMPDAIWYLMVTVGIGEVLAIGVLGTGLMYIRWINVLSFLLA